MAKGPARGEPVPEDKVKRVYVRYSQKVVNAICEEFAKGRTWSSICQDKGMPSHKSLHDWKKSKPGFAALVDQAREIGDEALVDEVLDIARAVTTASATADRLRMQGVQWAKGKNSPARQGARTRGAKGAVEIHIRVRRFEKLHDAEGRAFLREIFPEGER